VFSLGITVRIVGVHRVNILAKLKLDNAAPAVARLVVSRS
jgi:DNA-binding CsgD family transcriptional regulator